MKKKNQKLFSYHFIIKKKNTKLKINYPSVFRTFKNSTFTSLGISKVSIIGNRVLRTSNHKLSAVLFFGKIYNNNNNKKTLNY